MNTTTLKGNWDSVQDKLKMKYSQLTDDDLVYTDGAEDELVGRIQKKTGESRERIQRFIERECGCT
ncbi:MAG: general stress protein CsbD [Nibricoccus sp.]